MNLVEQAKIRLVIDGKDAINELQVIDAKITSLKDKQKDYAKGTAEYKALNGEIRELEKSYKLVEQRMDISKMSMKQLTDYQRDLNREIKQLDPASEAFSTTSSRIREVTARQSELGTMVKGQQSLWEQFGGWIKGAFAVVGIYEVWNAIKSFTTGSLEEAKKFESAAQSLRGEVTMTDAQFIKLKKSAQENGEAFGMTGEQMLNAYNAIASGKSDLIEVEGGIEKVTDAAIMLATNGGMELDVAAKVMTNSLNQFGAGAEDAAKYVDILSTGTIVGAGKIDEMGQSLKYVGPIAKAAGLSFGDTNAALQILHQNGIKGEQAGTALRGMLAHLMKGADDTNPSIVGMTTAIANLEKKQLSAKEMTKLFGQEAVSAGIAVVSNSNKLKEWTEVIEKGGGAAAMYAEKTKTVEFAEKQAAAAFANSRKEIGDKLLPIWVGLVNFFTEYGIPSIKAVATGIIAVINTLIELPKFIIQNKELFIALGVALVSLNAANIAAAASAIAHVAVEKSRQIATKAGAAAQWLLNAAMTANPIGLVVAGIAAFTGAIVWAYKNVDWFRAGIKATWAGLKEFAKIIYDVHVGLGRLDFSGVWDRIKNGWTSVSKASGDAYVKAMSESNKKVSANTAAAGKLNVDTAQKTSSEIENIYKKSGTAITDNEDKENKKRALSAEELHAEYLKLKTDFDEKIKKIDDDYNKWVFDEYQKRSKAIAANVEKIQKNLNEKEIADKKAHLAAVEKEVKSLNDGILQSSKQLSEKQKEIDTNRVKSLKELFDIQFADLLQIGIESFSRLSYAANEYFDNIIEFSDSATKRIQATLGKEMLKPWEDNIKGAQALMRGDLVGAVEGLFGYFKGMWDVTFGLKKTLKEISEIEFTGKFEQMFSDLAIFNDAIAETYGELIGSIAKVDNSGQSALQKSIQAELDLSNQINETYDQALSREDDLHDAKLSNIEAEYNAAITAINNKYALEKSLADVAFGANNLAIQEETNQKLIALLTNQETRLSLDTEYNQKRAFVFSQYADQIKDITPEMSQAEIDGINAAIQARDNALTEVEGWLQEELKAVFETEEQKRKEYTETERIIKEGQDRLNDLKIEYNADELERETIKNIALETAEIEKNKRVESEFERHNGVLVQLAQTKNAEIKASFERLKEAYLGGYAEMEAAAYRAYQAGIITLDEYQKRLDQLNATKQMFIGDIPSILDIKNRYDNVSNNGNGGVFEFAKGTEYVDPHNKYPDGVDTVPAMVTKGERIFDPGLNSLLDGMSNGEVVIRALNSVRNDNAGLIRNIRNSALAMTGNAAINTPVSTIANLAASSNQQPTITHAAVQSASISTSKMETLLQDIHSAIVSKPVMDWGTLSKYSDAERVNISRSRFA